jgi:predicted dinucleotide-binding enzyme
LIDIANTLDFSKGMPPTLSVCNDDSLGEQIQRTFPQLKVIKTLNTMNCKLMIEPSFIIGDHDIFICGNDLEAKEKLNLFYQSGSAGSPK